MKSTLKYYHIGSQVFAENHYSSNGKETSALTIYEAVVDSITISLNENGKLVEEYWLKTQDGQLWGDTVKAEYVSDSFNKLVAKVKGRWLAESNSFGDE